jgi:hypothetical protein
LTLQGGDRASENDKHHIEFRISFPAIGCPGAITRKISNDTLDCSSP